MRHRQLLFVLPTTPDSCHKAARDLIGYLKDKLDGFSWTETPSGAGVIRGWWLDEDGTPYEDRSVLVFADLDSSLTPKEVKDLLQDIKTAFFVRYLMGGVEQKSFYVALQFERNTALICPDEDIPEHIVDV